MQRKGHSAKELIFFHVFGDSWGQRVKFSLVCKDCDAALNDIFHLFIKAEAAISEQ